MKKSTRIGNICTKFGLRVLHKEGEAEMSKKVEITLNEELYKEIAYAAKVCKTSVEHFIESYLWARCSRNQEYEEDE